ncbi:NAD(P)H-binding protein [Bdellovibrio sp. HCB290]|uniref:NAD(P)H-binding protein n=1 Tax=Bdellovibrio sp. HCB290 TaxID=3394356 RepID=UPI0039B460F4
MKIAIAGASGFVGKALISSLKGSYSVVGLSRSHHTQSEEHSSCEWRNCDLFSLIDAEKALEGAEIAIYLVHSMRPSAHLSQGSFEDFDLIVADNFLRAAEKNKVKKIIYVGGLIPSDSKNLSKHLQSRQEVESVFLKGNVPTTILRAALILGAEGSSFQIMTRLVSRLPIMLCPRWTATPSQPVSVEDVLTSIRYCIETPETNGKIYDLGGPDVLSYGDMMLRVADILDLRRSLIRVPFLTPHLSALWVRLVTGAPKDLVNPLIESLRNPLLVREDHQLVIPGHKFMGIEESLREAIKNYNSDRKPHAFKAPQSAKHEVRSVQRMPLPVGWTAKDVAQEYMKFLPVMRPGFMKVEVKDRWIYFSNAFPYIRLLVLEYSPERSWGHRELFYVRGGLFSKKSGRGRLEFREVLGGTACIAAIHDFRPRLPWYFYKVTQAYVHLWVMKQFARHLARPLEQQRKLG